MDSQAYAKELTPFHTPQLGGGGGVRDDIGKTRIYLFNAYRENFVQSLSFTQIPKILS